MTSEALGPALAAERVRIVAEYQRRERELPADLWAPWQPAADFLIGRRNGQAARLLRTRRVFPVRGERCLEIGCGTVGWLGELVSWGLGVPDLHGLDLDPRRIRRAREALPGADLRRGDAAALPWPAGHFRLVIASTVLSSVLNAGMRAAIAREIERVLEPGGALLWYDLAVRNPWNPNVRPVTRRELGALFPRLVGPVKRISLAAPLARRIAPWSHLAASALEAVPWLRTHLLAVLVREG